MPISQLAIECEDQRIETSTVDGVTVDFLMNYQGD